MAGFLFVNYKLVSSRRIIRPRAYRFSFAFDFTFQRFDLGGTNREQSKTIPPFGGCFTLFLLLVDQVSLRHWVKLLSFVLLTWILFNLVVVAGVVNMAFSNAVFISYTNQLDK